MNKAESIAKELGELQKDEQWLQDEISRLTSKLTIPLDHLRELHSWLDEKRKARKSCRVIGDSDTGKTVACKSYQLRNKPIYKGRQTPCIPVVFITIPGNCTTKDFFKEILEALRYRAVRGTISDFRSRVMDVLKACEVEMLIIDEGDRFKADVFPEVRDISDRLEISVVLVGTDRLDTVIKRDEQVYNRFRSHRRFGRLNSSELKKTIAIWEKSVLKLPVPSNLTKSDLFKIINESTEGYIGRLDELLRDAAIYSLSRGRKRIEKDILEEVAAEQS